MAPVGGSPSQLSCPTDCRSGPGLLQGLSMGCASFRLHSLLCCGLLHGCMWRSALYGGDGGGTGGQPAPPWASSGLQGGSALSLEHLLTYFCPDIGGCWDVFYQVSLVSLKIFPWKSQVKWPQSLLRATAAQCLSQGKHPTSCRDQST